MQKTLLCLALLCLLNTSAYAYIDPGTGSFMLQGLIAAVLGGFYSIKIYYHRIKSFIFKGKSSEAKIESTDDTTAIK